MTLCAANIKVEPDSQIEVEVDLPPLLTRIKQEPLSPSEQPVVIKQEPVSIKQEPVSPTPASAIPPVAVKKEKVEGKPEIPVSKSRKPQRHRFVPYNRRYRRNNQYNRFNRSPNQCQAYRNYPRYHQSAWDQQNYQAPTWEVPVHQPFWDTSFQQGWAPQTYQQPWDVPMHQSSWDVPLSHFDEPPRRQPWNRQQDTFSRECNTARRSLVFSYPKKKDDKVVDLTVENLSPKLLHWKKYGLFKIGVWDKRYMTADKLAKVRRSLVMEIVKDKTKCTTPRVFDCICKTGWLEIACRDRQSRTWIQNAVIGLKPWPGAELRTKDCDDVEDYMSITVTASVTDAKDVAEMVTLLAKQNKGLSADKWRICKTITDAKHLKVDFIVSDGQMIELRRMDYNLNVGLGKATVQFKP